MITIVPYNPAWPQWFETLAKNIRQVLPEALAIHHIGSTSVPGLDAKNIIDIQVTVSALDERIVPLFKAIGFEFKPNICNDHRPPGRTDIPEQELTKLLFAKHTDPKAHLHVRVQGHFNQQYPLLCRDYLRSHPYAAQAYAEVKRQLAKHFPNDVEAYYDVKDPVFDIIMEGAYSWARNNTWSTPQSDG